jgi:hypothetical protein
MEERTPSYDSIGSLINRAPRWHRIARAVWMGMFILIFFEAVVCFVYFLILARGASPVPTSELTPSIVDHSHGFFVGLWQKRIYELLVATMLIGIGGIMLSGLLLHHLVGVKIFANR